MFFSYTKLWYFHKFFHQTYLEKYNLRSSGKALIYKLDFGLFRDRGSVWILDTRYKRALNPNSIFTNTEYFHYPSTFIYFKTKRIKVNKTLKIRRFEYLTNEDADSLLKTLYIDDIQILHNIIDKSVANVNRVVDRYLLVLRDMVDSIRNYYYITPNIYFVPPLYFEPFYLATYLRFRTRPFWQNRNVAKIDRYNYAMVIRFVIFNLIQKTKVLKVNIRHLRRMVTKFLNYYKLIFRIYRALNRVYTDLWKNYRKFARLSDFEKDFQYSILCETRKIKITYVHMRSLIRLRKIDLKKYISFLKVDLEKFIYHLNFFKRLYKRRIRFLNELIPLYHGGVQFVYLKLKQFFIDFHSTIRVLLKERRINYTLFSSYFKYFIKCGRYFMKHLIILQKYERSTNKLIVINYLNNLPIKLFIVTFDIYLKFVRNYFKYKSLHFKLIY